MQHCLSNVYPDTYVWVGFDLWGFLQIAKRCGQCADWRAKRQWWQYGDLLKLPAYVVLLSSKVLPGISHIPYCVIIEHNSPNLSSWTFDDETAFDRFHTSPKVLVAPAGQDTVKPRPPATSSSLAYVSCCVCYNFSLDSYYCAKVQL